MKYFLTKIRLFSFILLWGTFCSVIFPLLLKDNAVAKVKDEEKLPHPLPSYCLGSKDAPVTVYEFISLSCPFCAINYRRLNDPRDQDSLYPLMQQGKVKVVIKDFPIHGERDFLAHTLLYHSQNDAQFFNLVEIFLRSQQTWFSSKNIEKIIAQYGALSGLSEEALQDYSRDHTTPKLLQENANYYMSKYDIIAAPTTVVELSAKPINQKSKRFIGVIDPVEVSTVARNLLSNPNSPPNK